MVRRPSEWNECLKSPLIDQSVNPTLDRVLDPENREITVNEANEIFNLVSYC